jgi:hypothetical protein
MATTYDDVSPGEAQREPWMLDALGERRQRYVRVTQGGMHCVMRPCDGDGYVQVARDNGDDSEYIVSDVYLSEREFEELEEFEGF